MYINIALPVRVAIGMVQESAISQTVPYGHTEPLAVSLRAINENLKTNLSLPIVINSSLRAISWWLRATRANNQAYVT